MSGRLLSAGARLGPLAALRTSLAALLVLLGGAGCGETRAGGDGAATEPADGTERMAARLQARADTLDPWENRFANAARVAALESLRPPPSGPGRLRYEADLAEQLLYAARWTWSPSRS